MRNDNQESDHPVNYMHKQEHESETNVSNAVCCLITSPFSILVRPL